MLRVFPSAIEDKVSSSFNFIKIGITLLIVFATTFSAMAQQIEIKGRILDERTKDPVIGANIKFKNQKLGAIADVNGDFSLNTNSLPVALTITMIGYNNQEIDVYEAEPIVIYLAENAVLMNAVTVVGYGTQKRKELTGSITTVPKSALEHVTPTFDGMLGGIVAGVNVTQSSGQPGESSTVRIRGGNSIHAGNEPLYVIDGFIFYKDNSSTKTGLNGIEGNLNPLSSINPDDIESIDVLKDVSATAIYGSRGANGVIIVTTKKGKKTGNSINYQYTASWSKSSKKLDLMNASEWAKVQKDYFNNRAGYTDEEIAQLGEGAKWQDEVLNPSFSQTHNLSFSGGEDKTRYLVSGSYTNQPGIILNSGFERFSGRINFDRDIFKNFTIGITATADKSIQDALTTFESVNYNDSPYSHGITNSLTYALYMPPVVPIYNNDGSYNYNNPYEYSYLVYDGKTANPVSDLKNSIGETIKSSLLGSFFAKYSFGSGFVAKISAGTNANYVTQNFFAPSYTALGLEKEGIGGIGNKQYNVSQMEYTLNYNKKINKDNYIDVLAGYTYQNTKTNYALNLTSHLLTFNNLAAGSKPFPPYSNTTESNLNSYLGRVNYTFRERYNLTATMRADKSSRFAQGNQWGYFPSIGLSWNIDKENFLNSLDPIVSSLKLRATFGTVGNTEIGDYEYSQNFTASIYNNEVAYNISNLGNENLKWETTAQYNLGIDAGFLNDRLLVVADVYAKKTSDLLLEIPVDPWSGTSEDQLVNLGNVTNKGVEFTLTANILNSKKRSWSASANIARNINTITSMGKYNDLITGTNQESILRVGESLGSFYGLVFDGVVQTNEDISKLPTIGGSTPKPGDTKFVDTNLDGSIDNKDRKVLGSTQPDFIYGFYSTFTFNNFDLYFALQGSQGNEVYNLLGRYLERPTDSYNMSASLLNSWTEETPSNTVPKIGSPLYSFVDSRYVEDASYLKISNITLGYTLSIKTQQSPINLRIYSSVHNLYTLTGYNGYDPEIASGIDLGIYPSSRSFVFGLSVNF